MLKEAEDINITEQFFNKGRMIIDATDWPLQLKSFIIPLAKKYPVEFDRQLITEIREGQPEKKLVLQEKGDYLVFQPIFSYKGFETKGGDKSEIIIPDNDKVLIIHRNKEVEQEFIDKLEALHSNFIKPEGSHNLVLKGSEVLRNNWFFCL